MNLAVVSKFFKRWFRLVVVIFLVVGIFGVLSKRDAPRSEEIPPIVTRVPTTGKAFEYRGDGIDLLSELAIYKFDPSTETISLTKARVVAAHLGFTEEPQTVEDVVEGTAYIWSEGGRSWSVLPQSGRISYADQFGAGGVVFLPTVQETARSFLERAGLFGGLELNKDRVRYLVNQTGRYVVVEDSGEAEAVEVFFRYRLGDQPLFEEVPAVDSVSVIVGGGRVLKLEGWLFDDALLTSEGEIRLKSFDQVVEDLQSGQAGVLALDSETKEFSRAVFTRAELGYLRKMEEGLVMPVVVFYGEAQLSDGAAAGIVAAVSAVKSAH
ncbi:hypothetical protein L6258_00900 [Candidatus Parcubacteria bacterium]|nr:hypothetical protein [Candidatus Parcubacteria bacterium]